MDARETRGLVIAATCRLKRLESGEWVVPSQSTGDKTYVVNVEKKTCTCPDYQENRGDNGRENGHVCKHYWAASITLKRDTLPDGTTIETKSITLVEKKTYKQDWPAYNRAQSTEKNRLQVLRHELSRNLPDRERVRKSG